MGCSGFLSQMPGTTGICCLIDSLSPRRTSTPPPSSRNTPSSPTPPSPQHPPASNFLESRSRACTALLFTAVTVIIGPVTLTSFFVVVCTLRRCHGPHGRASFLGSSMVTCACCQHNRCYSGFCVEPTSQPSHPVATDGCKASHQLWPQLCTGHFHRWHCEVGAGSVLGLCTRFVCGCCAQSAPHVNRAWGAKASGVLPLSAVCQRADYLDRATHVAGVLVRSRWRPAQQGFWLVDGLRLCKTGRRSLGRSRTAGGALACRQQALRGGLTPRLHTLFARLATAGASVF